MALTIKVAVPVPLRRIFDYSLPDNIDIENVHLGARVLVPFRSKSIVGVVCESNEPVIDNNKLKAIDALIDPTPVIDEHMYQLLNWAAHYYQHPIGDVFQTALPVLLRQNKTIKELLPNCLSLTEKGKQWSPLQLGKAVKQQKALKLFKQHKQLDATQLKLRGISSQILRVLKDKKLIEERTIDYHPFEYYQNQDDEKPLNLNEEQEKCVTTINQHNNQFYPCLIEGVTGSGKTEVYLQVIHEVLKQNRQVLVLVPEIGLTPQTLNRFSRRFSNRIDIWHSAMTNNERFNSWQNARSGLSAITIGTRSSIFLPFRDLGLIVIDEEHDNSFKQQDNFKYNARDMAIYRAKMLDIPIVLGTATPALETLNNALSKRYHHFTLSGRISGHEHKYQVIDIKGLPLQGGLSTPMIQQIEHHLNEHNQVMLFLNRRGYAPTLICHECGWLSECKRCDANYTLHKAANQQVCHHCGSISRIPVQCGQCGSTNIQTTGQGTEQIEEQLQTLFPEVELSRLDRDSTRRKGSFEQQVEQINQPGRRLIVGTQMIAKGHHFPNVTLVAILDVDGALFSADFRAAEKLAQLLIQVSGRAGRGSKSGEILVQTHFPSHPLLQDLINHGYSEYARELLNERQQALLPPFYSQLMIRSQGPYQNQVKDFLAQVREIISPFEPHIEILGPLPAPMEKIAGNYRFQLLVQSAKRGALQSVLTQTLTQIEKLKLASKVRWSLDIDPQQMT